MDVWTGFTILTLTRQVLKLSGALNQIADDMDGVPVQSVVVPSIRSLVAFFNERCGKVRGVPFGDPGPGESCCQLCADLAKTSIEDMDWTDRMAKTYVLRMAKCIRDLICLNFDSESEVCNESQAHMEVRALHTHSLSSSRM